MSTIIPEQLLSTEGIEPTFPKNLKAEKNSLTPPSHKTQSKKLFKRDKNVQKIDEYAVNAATKKTADNDNINKIINFLIEHDNASKNGETSPGNLLNSLLEECRGSQNEKMQKAVKNFDAKIENFQKNFKNTKNLGKLVIPSKSMLPPSASTRKLPHKIINEEFDQKVDNEVRKPLFKATKALVIAKLKQTKDGIIEAKSTANEDAFSQVVKNFSELRTEQVKYIALLSSIDRKGTISLLQSDEGCMLLPTYLRNPDASPEVNYKNFLEDLYTLTHPAVNEKKAEQNTDKELLEKYGGNETEPLLQASYSNLTLGRPLYKYGAHEVLSAENSPYFVQGQMELLEAIAETVEAAHSGTGYGNTRILEDRNLPDGFRYGGNNDQHYIGKDKILGDLLHIAVREVKNTDGTVKEISLAKAKKLGLVTPEDARKLEEKNIQTVKLMLIVPRFELEMPDTIFTAIPNIMKITPKILALAEEFTKKAIDEIKKKNEVEKENGINKSVYVPVCAAFCMGAMTAQAIATKCNIASLGFNSFNPDPDVLKRFAGTDKIKQANDPEHALCHQIYRMIADYISDPNFSDSQVRNDISQGLLAPKIEALEGALKELHQHLEAPVTLENFTEWLSTVDSNLKDVFDKTNELMNRKSSALKYEVKNFFANKPVIVGQPFELKVSDNQKQKGDGGRHEDYPEAISALLHLLEEQTKNS